MQCQLEYYEMLHALFCVRSHIISQKDLFQTLDWGYEVSLK